MLRPAAGAVLVVGPGPEVPACRAELVARVTAGLLQVRARRAREVRLHEVVVRLLLSGRTDLAREIGGVEQEYATVYRVSGGRDPVGAAGAVWEAVFPAARGRAEAVLIVRMGDDLAVVVLHDASGGQGWVLRLVARAARSHGLLAGVADPVPVDRIAGAWAEAGQARQEAGTGRRLVPAAWLGHGALARIVPADRYAAWAARLLLPVDAEQRRVLEYWLRSASVGDTAEALGISRGTVRARLRAAARLLEADLDRPRVRAELLIALRAPAAGAVPVGGGEGVAGRVLDLVEPDVPRHWALGTVEPLGDGLRRVR
ncbi:helix-turn-helix domain-containing protein [Streptomyces sp. NPDC050509]|uniref:helix-turn-helix domain-containing protein n=1 Tax=Streptomyces sp. NPDC050509 TaxID=3365620 RepID=UPI0037A73027